MINWKDAKESKPERENVGSGWSQHCLVWLENEDMRGCKKSHYHHEQGVWTNVPDGFTVTHYSEINEPEKR